MHQPVIGKRQIERAEKRYGREDQKADQVRKNIPEAEKSTIATHAESLLNVSGRRAAVAATMARNSFAARS